MSLPPSSTGTTDSIVRTRQLAVVQGLVMERIQTLSRGSVVFKERCCRVSYGMKCREEWNPSNPKHIGQKVTLDSRDGKKWVENQIDWFVKQGENIPITGISKPYGLKVRLGNEYKPWTTTVVMSTSPLPQLPSNIDQDGVKTLCIVESVLAEKPVEKKLKNRHWYNSGEKYLRVRFDVKVILGPADLKFQLWSKQGQLLSSEHDPISVKWDPPVQREEDRDGLATMYRETPR